MIESLKLFLTSVSDTVNEPEKDLLIEGLEEINYLDGDEIRTENQSTSDR